MKRGKAKKSWKKMRIQHLIRNGAVTRWQGNLKARRWASNRAFKKRKNH